MHTIINIASNKRAPGCFLRDPGIKDVADTFHKHKGIYALYGRKEENRYLKDWAVQHLLKQNRIDAQTAADYKKRVYSLFNDAENADKRSVEQMDAEIQLLRCECFGEDTMETLQREMAQESCVFDLQDGIDQRTKKDAILLNASAVIFVCDEAKMVSVMRKDVQTALQAGKDVYVLAHRELGRDIANVARLKAQLGDHEQIKYLLLGEGNETVHAADEAEAERLNKQIAQGEAVLLYYGESGLLFCRDLLVDAVVHAVPWGYFARAMTNQLDVDRACVVYVPKGVDVTPWVPLREKTRLNYHHLFTLWANRGDEIYDHSVEELYRLYPQYFLNIYENNTHPVEVTPEYPIRFEWKEQNQPAEADAVLQVFDTLREQTITAYLDGLENVEYRTGYLDEEKNLHPVDYQIVQKRNGVMVHGVKVKKAVSSGVVSCDFLSLRRMLQYQPDSSCEKLRIYSNFLFFLTPVIARVHNALRSERPYEQIDFDKSHVDYMLLKSAGKRTEAFPLYKKACVAMKEDGTFLFFNFRLGGGKIKIGETELCWSREDVDPEEVKDGRVCVYTPFNSQKDLQDDPVTYAKLVGEGRINLVVIQDRIICIRKGNVILPCMGVVISVDEETGMKLLQDNALCLNDEGYAEGIMPTPEVQLDAPEGISPAEWKKVVWSYGGGMSLMLDRKSICDEDGPGMLKCLEKEGWMSPLSQQTQESGVHRKERHPRTAIGTTDTGELIILVYSGRTKRSGGADYDQMITAARQLFPDIRNLMNVDGGGSSVLGLAIGSSFMELSYPSTSFDSCVGMVRPINTVFCVELT